MKPKTKTFKIRVFRSDSKEFLQRIASLLIYSKEWTVEKTDFEKYILIKRTNLSDVINVTISTFGSQDETAEICISSENIESIEFDYAVSTFTSCAVFLLDDKNKQIIEEIVEKAFPEFSQAVMNSVKEDLNFIDTSLTRLKQEPAFHLLLAMRIVREVIPDIENKASTYWDKIQPLHQYLDGIIIDDAEEKLNLALGLELEPLEAAMANFMLMILWLTRRSANGEIRWNGEGLQNIPDIKPLARQIISSTKKHLIRDPRSLDSLFVLRLQRAAYYFLNERESMGEAEHAIAKLRSLINAGFIEAEKKDSGEENPVKRRNDGKALEEEVKELLQSMGLKAATTKTTGDGGIDIIAYSDSPLFSGKYVVQCKDWTGSVGEGVIRDLYGVVTAESANKGILITTGTITKSAQKFAEGKPLELIDGEQLSKLLHKFKPS